ncbi:hypothetical protein V8F44DRAFT_652252 [Aspergillus fumigatus]
MPSTDPEKVEDSRRSNFVDETKTKCFDQTDDRIAFLTLNSAGLDKILDTVKQDGLDVGVCSTPPLVSANPNPAAHSQTSMTPPPSNTRTTFTSRASSFLSAGIFSASANSNKISTSRLWWFWMALTFPLTVIAMAAWWA